MGIKNNADYENAEDEENYDEDCDKKVLNLSQIFTNFVLDEDLCCSAAEIYLFLYADLYLYLFANRICLKLVFLSGRWIPQFLWPGLKISPPPCWFSSVLSNRLHVVIISQR